MRYLCNKIRWDDPDELMVVDLPTEIIIDDVPSDLKEKELEDYLSDKLIEGSVTRSWCAHKGFCYKSLPPETLGG